MGDELRVRLAKSRLEQERPREHPKFNARNFALARKQFADPNRKVQMFPIVISPDGLFKTPEDAKEFLNLPKVPEMYVTHGTDLSQNDTPENPAGGEVTICEVEITGISRIICETKNNSFGVWFHETKRLAWKALSRKETDSGTED